MKIIGSMIELVLNGKIGNIQCGKDRSEIVNEIGEPEEWEVWGSKKNLIQMESDWWSYGLFMVYFKDNKVKRFGIYYTMQDVISLPRNFIIVDLWSKNPTLKDLIEYLKRNDLEKYIDKLYIGYEPSTLRAIHFKSGVIVFGSLRQGVISIRSEINSNIHLNSKRWKLVMNLDEYFIE
jgi:hypothetical protein